MIDRVNDLSLKFSYWIGAVIAALGGVSQETLTFMSGVVMFSITYCTNLFFKQRQDKRDAERLALQIRDNCESCPAKPLVKE